jgi:hypothetical protein
LQALLYFHFIQYFTDFSKLFLDATKKIIEIFSENNKHHSSKIVSSRHALTDTAHLMPGTLVHYYSFPAEVERLMVVDSYNFLDPDHASNFCQFAPKGQTMSLSNRRRSR